MTTTEWVEVVVLVVCIFGAAMASGTETALTSINRLRVRHLAEEGSQKAATLQRLHSDPNRFLSTVLVINTVALIVASASATLLSSELLRPYLPAQLHTVGDFAVSILLSIFLLIFAEVTPKTLAVRNADRIALQVARPVDALATALSPVLWFVTAVSRAIVPGGAHGRAYVTEGELMTLLNVSEEQGEIRDEYDLAEREPLEIISDHEARVDARFPMDELNERLELGISESDEYDSVGGYVISALGSIPDEGATLESNGVRWRVEAVNGHRILQLRLDSDHRWPREVLIEAGLLTQEEAESEAAEDSFQ